MNLGHLDFDIVSDLDIRISDFSMPDNSLPNMMLTPTHLCGFIVPPGLPCEAGHSTTVEEPLQISSFLTNKASFPDDQMNVTVFYIKDYENNSNCKLCEYKANTKPIKPNFRKAKMKLNFFATKDYENKSRLRAPGKQTQSKPISKANQRCGKDRTRAVCGYLLFIDPSASICYHKNCKNASRDYKSGYSPFTSAGQEPMSVIKKKQNVFVMAIVVVMQTASPAPAGWSSSLYPEDWTPGCKDDQGRFLHDFSYAGYHKSEAPIPINPPGLMVDVTLRPYGADNTGATDATSSIQAAIDTVGIAGGGIVYLPVGIYRLRPPSESNCALCIWHSGVVLRGAGPGQTFLFNDETYMRNKSVILVSPSTGGWHSPLAGTSVYITQDVDYPTHIIPVAKTELFNVGDWVVLRTDCTDSFIAEHSMTDKWNSSLKGITFYRKVTAVDPISNTITVDIPTRYYLKTRDNARVYKVGPHLEEIGIEFLSIGMRENLTGGLGDNDYNTSGTAAYEVHGSHFIQFHHIVNSWIQDVETYRPPVNTNNWHTVSNIILLSQSRNVTVRNCVVARPQYEGGGGNGYGYTLRGSDCLITDCTAFHTRHNYDFKSMWTSGNVIFRCVCRDGRLPSDFHMHLSPANLFDSMYVDGDLLQAVYRPYGTIMHGQTTTESVFWNTYGTERCGARLIVSRQWKWGYVIGTSGPVHNVELGTRDNTAPEDFLEGQGQGETLVPQSLYLDQLYRRRGKDLDFSGRVDFADFSIFTSYWMNSCNSPDWCYGCDFDNSGEVNFGDLAEFIDDWLVQK